MVRKYLTSLERMEQHFATAELLAFGSLQQQQRAYEFWKEKGIIILKYRTLPKLNVQKLLMAERAMNIIKTLILIPPRETIPATQALIVPPYELEEIERKNILARKVITEAKTFRRERMKPLLTREKVRLLRLHKIAINAYEQQALALLESWLWTFKRTEVQQIMEKIIEMCRSKQLYLERLIGEEPLQKLMLQLYVAMFQEMPATLNMIAVRVTQMTMQALIGMTGTLYRQVSAQASAVKSKSLLISAQKRRLETKAVASSKVRTEEFPTKADIGDTTDLSKSTQVSAGKDLAGKDMAVLALAWCMDMPYFLKRWFARHVGLPENSPLYHKPYVWFIPVRRTLGLTRRRRYTGEAITNFNRDEYMKMMKKWRKLYG